MNSNDLIAGKPVTLISGIQRLIAPNAGMMTGPGTNTYLLGKQNIAVIDPGPRIDAHIESIIEAASGPIKWILVTHTHPDHSPAAMKLASATGAEILGIVAPPGRHQDRAFTPDRTLADGESFSTDEFELQIVHTPGHASNHLCYLHTNHRWLFTGDHIINGSTVVIDPPDGSMTDYLQSLKKLQNIHIEALAPGHGAIMENVNEALAWLIDHRLKRETKVTEKLKRRPNSSLATLVTHVYDDVSPSLHPLAQRSLLAHLLKLELEGLAIKNNDNWHAQT